VAPSRRPKSGTRYSIYWDTVGLEVLWSGARKTVSDKGYDVLELMLSPRLIPTYNQQQKE